MRSLRWSASIWGAFSQRRFPTAAIQQTCCRNYHIVVPGKVSATRSVPESIVRPPYVNQTFWQSVLSRKRKVNKHKSSQEIRALKDACYLARDILSAAGDFVKEGVTTDEIDGFIHELAIRNNAYPSPLSYKGFPKSVCTSVNNVACHGIPDDRPLQNGDIINVDVTVYYNGYHGDTSSTFLIGDVDDAGQRLVEVARRCRDVAIMTCGPGEPLANIGNIISEVSSSEGFDIVADFCGHGIGEYFHGPPDIFHIANNLRGKMEEGMAFTIEPVITEGDPTIRILRDHWTAVSVDNSRSAQFEHTILITSTGAEILTENKAHV